MIGRHRLVDVVDFEEVVIDHSLDQVESAEPGQHAPRQHASRPPEMPPMRPPPEQQDTRQDKAIGRRVEEPVRKGVDPQVLDRFRRIAGAAEHAVPLKELVRHNSVKEATEAQAEQNSSGGREPATLSLYPLVHDQETRFPSKRSATGPRLGVRVECRGRGPPGDQASRRYPSLHRREAKALGFAELVVDIDRRDLGLRHRNRDLIEPRHRVPGGIAARERATLACVRNNPPRAVELDAEGGGE